MTKAIIDTSAWIDFFRNKDSPTGDVIASLIEQDLTASKDGNSNGGST